MAIGTHHLQSGTHLTGDGDLGLRPLVAFIVLSALGDSIANDCVWFIAVSSAWGGLAPQA